MKIEACIEIPKGDSRRRHTSWDGSGQFVDLGTLQDAIPLNEGRMPVHYGYILNTLNTKETPSEELDVLVLSERAVGIGDKMAIRPIAVFRREDGDHKIVAVEESNQSSWEQVAEEEKALLQGYFAYKSPILSIGTAEEAVALIESCKSV